MSAEMTHMAKDAGKDYAKGMAKEAGKQTMDYEKQNGQQQYDQAKAEAEVSFNQVVNDRCWKNGVRRDHLGFVGEVLRVLLRINSVNSFVNQTVWICKSCV